MVPDTKIRERCSCVEFHVVLTSMLNANYLFVVIDALFETMSWFF